MNIQFSKLALLPLLGVALIFTACGKKSSESSGVGEIDIPDSPDGAIQAIMREVANGNGAVLWQAMPEAYQNDVNQIAQLAGGKVDAEIYNMVFASVGRLIQVADKQKEFIFNTSLGGADPAEEKMVELRAAWPSLMNFFNSVMGSSIATAEGLQSFDGQAFFSETVSSLLKHMDALLKIRRDSAQPPLSEFKDVVIGYIDGTGDDATLEMTLPNGTVEVEVFINIEGRWVPQEMAAQWSAQMAQARAQLEAIDATQIAQQKPQILGVFAMIDGVLSQIEAAETQEQFDQALQGAMMPLMGLMMMGQGMGGGAPAMPAMPMAPVAP